MRALAIHVTKNSSGKSDATGAFIPEAIAFQRMHSCDRVGCDTAEQVGAALLERRDLDVVAFFCHGLRRSLRVGFATTNGGVDRLADAIAEASGPHVIVPLYACSTGASDTGFAALFAHTLHARGKTGHVDAHTTAAHTTRNPFVRRFTYGEPRGTWLVEPASPLWKRWRAALQGDLRLRFPFMTVEAVHAELGQPAG